MWLLVMSEQYGAIFRVGRTGFYAPLAGIGTRSQYTWVLATVTHRWLGAGWVLQVCVIMIVGMRVEVSGYHRH